MIHDARRHAFAVVDGACTVCEGLFLIISRVVPSCWCLVTTSAPKVKQEPKSATYGYLRRS